MKTTFKVIEIINIAALLFLLAGAYGLPFTGVLQTLAALLFVFIFPKNKLIYVYFGLSAAFFLIWDYKSMDWLFLLPGFLVFFLTFIIYRQKNHLKN